ncbi:Tetratricopeptide repeat-containing protein [Ekhidna lutea]|uniref:Tetratricopeptide repeat-containing protein n=1 Tax=Ekhidna lutea TaxID=447679 RepID=A0A239IV21_EKHLU|nr:tetratricopeptide repeat protein [Ekhidna lutea]SNS97375.1 Tetratricopeptide repeat-containing protein [Ekhidna lutea]
MRLLLISILILGTLSSFSQKGKKGKDVVIPQTQEDSLKLEGVLVEAEKQLILENYAKALENFHVAMEMNTESAAIHFKIAEVLAKSNEGQKALPYGLEAIELAPTNKYYRLGLARIYQSIGFYLDAAKTYEELLEQFPSEENALYELAELYQLTGRREEMFRVFDQIEAQLGVKEEITREKQRIYMKEGKVDQVVIEFKKLIDAYPNESSYKAELINFLIQNGKLEEAETAIAQYEATESTSSRITLMKSELNWMRGNRAESLKLLTQAFETTSIDFDSKFQILSNYFVMAKQEEDKMKLTQVAEMLARQYPDEFKAQAFVGDMLYQSGKSKEAVTYYLKAVDLSPANYSVWQNILNVEADLNQYDSVVVHAEKALEYFPNQALLYYFAGTGHLIKNNYKKSVRMLEQGRKYTVDPNLLTVFYGQLGDAYNGMKEQDKSFKAYEKALENGPNNDHVLNNYSYFLSLANKNLEKALEMSTRLVEQHPDNPTYLDTHGWVLYTNGQFKESKKFLEKAVSLDEDGTVIEHYGDVLFKLGEVEKAIIQWEKARDLGNASELIEKKIADRKLYE